MPLTRRKPDFYADSAQAPSDASVANGNKAVPPKLQMVLLVEDNDVLREVMEACLGMMGYGVIPCHEAHAACLAFRSSPVTFC